MSKDLEAEELLYIRLCKWGWGDHSACCQQSPGRDRLRRDLSDGYSQFTVSFAGYTSRDGGHEQMLSILQWGTVDG